VEILELRDKIKAKRRVEIIRRGFEAALLLSVGGVVLGQQSVRSLAWAWKKGTTRPLNDFAMDTYI
jgi:hypothetical protein